MGDDGLGGAAGQPLSGEPPGERHQRVVDPRRVVAQRGKGRSDIQRELVAGLGGCGIGAGPRPGGLAQLAGGLRPGGGVEVRAEVNEVALNLEHAVLRCRTDAAEVIALR